ncbi:MAG: NADH-quinone oxidoreductase subunit L [Nitrospinae bacterium]|nr:NADH-quinone oxidoreductase subunit L [Nitrospinota bacterium]
MKELILFTLIAPISGFMILALSGNSFSEKKAGLIGSISVGIAFLATFICLIDLVSGSHVAKTLTLYNWVSVGNFNLNVSILVDTLSIVMLMIINGVGFVIHCYSVEYMHGEKAYSRFFSHMNLFIFSMNVLVLSADFFFLIVGWALVGLSSYFLIGFYTEKHSAVLAARKAFVMNVIGDVGMLVGALILFQYIGSVTYADVFSKAGTAFANDNAALAWACSLLLIGAFAKSAQFPLHTWLPDAMEGPTPVSALIHAATMVTAGVYLIVRCHVIFELVPNVMEWIVFIGILTSFMAATIGLVKYDIKRVIAYSTMSQLGYMFVAAGLGYYALAIFHLMTHAFFKALLFLSAGSVIHGLNGEQDIRKMGGLKEKMPVTFYCFMIGSLALCGFPLFSGFYSKEAIITVSFMSEQGGYCLWFFAIFTAFLTSVYTFRNVFLTFWGEYRGSEKPHESNYIILVPLIILALLAIIGGYWKSGFSEFLSYTVKVIEDPHNTILLIIGVIVPLAGIYTAYQMFVVNTKQTEALRERFRPLFDTLQENYYFDLIYDMVFVKPVKMVGYFLGNIFEPKIVDRLVDLAGEFADFFGQEVTMKQDGKIRSYGLMVFTGAVFVVSSFFLLFHINNF